MTKVFWFLNKRRFLLTLTIWKEKNCWLKTELPVELKVAADEYFQECYYDFRKNEYDQNDTQHNHTELILISMTNLPTYPPTHLPNYLINYLPT
jgi:hypothetical protein